MFRSLLSKLCYPDSDDFDVVPEVHAIQAIARMAPVRPVKPSVLANMMSFLYNPPPQATYHLIGDKLLWLFIRLAVCLSAGHLLLLV